MPAIADAVRPANRYQNYHAHVYFDETTRDAATRLCTGAAQLHGVQMGRIHSKLVGPHPRWSCQLAFDTDQFDCLIPWLELNRDGLTVLVHGLSGNALEDHTAHAAWLGDLVALDLSVFGD